VWTAIVCSLISGVLLTAGFPRLELPWLSWVALIPLFIAVRGKNWKQALILGFACGMAHYLTAVYWIVHAVSNFGGLPFVVAVLLLVLLCSYLALYTSVFSLAANRWASRPRLWTLGLPVVWVALELVRAHALTGFPWANLGYTQTPFAPLMQTADISGVYGVSWLVVFGNTCLASYLNRNRLHRVAAVFVVCLVGAVLYGNWRIGVVEDLQKDATPFEVGVVQGNIEQSLKWDPAFQLETLDRYRRLSLDATGHNPTPRLLVWPETSAPFIYGNDKALTRILQGIFAEIGVPVLFGSPAVEWRGADPNPRFFNRSYLVDGRGALLGSYAKQHLVPFGEYVPLRKVLFFAERLVESVGDFVPGDDPSPLKLDGQKLGILICYEDIFADLGRAAVNHGANMLINITNDAWYGVSSAPYQHAEMAAWRAVEFRVPMIRAANTGISAIIDAAGRICGSIPLNEEGFLVCSVKPIALTTFYARWGDIFAQGCVLIAFVLVIISFRSERFHRS
jgi:apolipoprotein N-acyltransferase